MNEREGNVELIELKMKVKSFELFVLNVALIQICFLEKC